MQIIHVDVDAFFAAVEELDYPNLKGKPVIVGGGSERGVVTTANYIARKYGIHSAMPGFKARKLCPNGCFRPVRHKRYREVSKEIFKILYSVTSLVEPLSIDEAFLDVTDIDKDPVEIAKSIKYTIKKNVGVTVSTGVSYNKFLAKLASDWNKPDGLKVITKKEVPNILRPLPVKSVYGIGEKTAKKLNKKGIYKIDDLLNLSKDYLYNHFGKLGIEIYNRIRGIDNRKVNTERERKSYGKEVTLDNDISSKEEMKKYIEIFAKNISKGLYDKNIRAKTVTFKYKTSSFEVHTKSKTLNRYIQSYEEILGIGLNILDTIEFNESIRLIGLTVSNLQESKIYQLSFLEDENLY